MSHTKITKDTSNREFPSCPLCQNKAKAEFCRDKFRTYFRCANCDLIFIAPEQRLSQPEEKAQYDLHQNDPHDLGYRKFLSRLFTPLQQRLKPKSKGLDFGSGPGPTLSLMFEEAGHTMNIFDPFFAPNKAVLDQTYDFITATEVVEHLYHPQTELENLWTRLKPGGLLGIMTKLALDKERFKQWHYRTEATHVCFFSRATFEYLAKKWNAELIFVEQDAILLRKPT